MDPMPARMILFHKPYGVLSQFTPRDGHPGLSSFGLPKGVYAVGRLDRDSVAVGAHAYSDGVVAPHR